MVLILEVRGGSSALGNIVKTFGGSGSGNYPAGGAAPNVTASIISTTLNKAGNGGSHKSGSLSSASAAGGASVYNGYGAGGSGSAPTGSHPGSSGYVKIVYKGN